MIALGAACFSSDAEETDEAASSSGNGGSSSGSYGGRGRSSSSGGESSSSGGSSGRPSSSSSGGGSSSSSSGAASSSSSSGGGDLDAGSDAGEEGDASPNDGGSDANNVIVNGSFEQWSQGKPVGWHGTTTNLDGAIENTTATHDGVRSATLNNPSSTHKRFSTVAAPWPAGRYRCSYWALGTGDVRNAFFAQDYSSYTAYTSLVDSAWREITYSFNLTADANVELIFSVRNTTGAGLSIDQVACAPVAD